MTDKKSTRHNSLTFINSHLWLILTYLLLALILTWPTVTHITTHLPGDGADDPAIAWNLWWIKHALLAESQNPFHTDFMFYPLGINLAFYTLTLLNGVTALPLTLNVGVVAASNLHMLFTFVIGGYGTFLLTRYILSLLQVEVDSKPVALWISAAGAGIFYAFASNKLFYIALGQFNIGSSHWIPFATLYLLRSHHQPHRWQNPLLAALFVTLQAWAEMTYASFLLILIGLYWLYWLLLYLIQSVSHRFQQQTAQSPHLPISPSPHLQTLRHRSGQLAQSPHLHLRAALILLATFALGLSPILAQMVPDMLAEGDFLVEGGGFAGAFSADLLGFLIPTLHHPLLGDLITQTGIGNFSVGQHIYIGFVLLGLTALNLRLIYRQPMLRFWLVAASVFALLCLGPVITTNGSSTGLPGPFVILQQLPFFKGNRYPSRYSVMLLLSLSVLAGYGLWHLSHRVNQRRYLILTGLIALLFLFEHLSLPLPQSDMRVPEPYALITDAPDEAVLLEIPLAWRNGFSVIGAQTTQFMFGQFYQTKHQKRLLQGNTSRNPALKFHYFVRAPIINSLLALETGKPLPPERWAADRAIAAEVLNFFNIRYIVVRPYSYTWLNTVEEKNITASEQAAIPYIEDVLPVEKIHDGAGMKIYRVTETDTLAAKVHAGLQIDTASPLAPLIFGEGWGLVSPDRPVTAQRQRVRLLLPLSEAAHHITLRLRLPEAYQAAPQTVRIDLNGWQSSPRTISRAWQEITFDIPAGTAHAGLNDVWLHFSDITTLPPPQPGTPIHDVTTFSAGLDVGNVGHIFINGYDVSPNGTGYNVVRLEPDGTFHAANFNTNADPTASARLADFINATPDSLIAAAVADEASANLGEEAVSALRAIGGTTDLRGCFRCSHAFIRTGDGAMDEAGDALRPVAVTTGLGVSEPGIAAMVDWVRIE